MAEVRGILLISLAFSLFTDAGTSGIPVEQCRLVKYDHINDVLDRSYDLNTEDGKSTLSSLLGRFT